MHRICKEQRQNQKSFESFIKSVSCRTSPIENPKWGCSSKQFKSYKAELDLRIWKQQRPEQLIKFKKKS